MISFVSQILKLETYFVYTFKAPFFFCLCAMYCDEFLSYLLISKSWTPSAAVSDSDMICSVFAVRRFQPPILLWPTGNQYRNEFSLKIAKLSCQIYGLPLLHFTFPGALIKWRKQEVRLTSSQVLVTLGVLLIRSLIRIVTIHCDNSIVASFLTLLPPFFISVQFWVFFFSFP